MKPIFSIWISILLMLHLVSSHSLSPKFDYFLFTLQWPGSLVNTTHQKYCYPKLGKLNPDFFIKGLKPELKSGDSLIFCDTSERLDPHKIRPLVKLLMEDWPSVSCPSTYGRGYSNYTWRKYGSCTDFSNPYKYFASGLNLKYQVNLLHILQSQGIKPDGGFYNHSTILRAVKKALGVDPGIRCNVDQFGHFMLQKIYLCVDTSATKFIECPGSPPHDQCGDSFSILFRPF